MRTLKKSNAQFRRASKRLPLGVSSNFRYWGDNKTIYIKNARGARLTDIDGNEYIDYRLGYGPSILGYADPRVDEAAREGMKIGGVFALATEAELDVAERIAAMVPTAEMVRFSNSGTEAVMAALRLARGYTKRDSYVIVEGGYHGVFDAVLWRSDVANWQEGGDDPKIVPYSDGVPKLLKRLFHTVPLNDTAALRAVFENHGADIGAFLIEPIMGNCCSLTATQKYLTDVRQLCDEFGVLLIVDEVKTGFRVAKGGVQELLGIQADICTFAKAVANGYPMSVLAGRREVMAKIGDGVVHGGTFTAHSVALAAADKTLEILNDTDALASIERYGTKLQTGISSILTQRSIAHCYVGHPSMGGLFFRQSPPLNYRDWAQTNYQFYDTMVPHLHELGILVEPDSREPWFICEAHDEHCLDETLTKFELAVDQTIQQLQQTK